MKMYEKKLLTVPECAEVMSLSKDTIYNLIHERKLNSVKVGKKFLISVVAIDKWIDETTNEWYKED